MLVEKLIDLFQFREGYEEDGDSLVPKITTGSVVWGVLIRSFIIILGSTYIIQKYMLDQYWFMVIILLWFLVAFPAYRQYTNFQHKMADFKDETLCGSCRYFEANAQLCKLYDQHVTKTIIPCEGESWEPKSYEELN